MPTRCPKLRTTPEGSGADITKLHYLPGSQGVSGKSGKRTAIHHRPGTAMRGCTIPSPPFQAHSTTGASPLTAEKKAAVGLA
jgi:hypothetical protein